MANLRLFWVPKRSVFQLSVVCCDGLGLSEEAGLTQSGEFLTLFKPGGRSSSLPCTGRRAYVLSLGDQNQNHTITKSTQQTCIKCWQPRWKRSLTKSQGSGRCGGTSAAGDLGVQGQDGFQSSHAQNRLSGVEGLLTVLRMHHVASDDF